MKKQSIIPFCFLLTLSSCKCNNSNQDSANQIKPNPSNEKDTLAFGDKNWISNGLKGKIYYLPENTSQLPKFDTMEAHGTIYTKTIDVPNRSWSTGFPGVSDRFEWFAIEYKGKFKTKKAGHYVFRLVSDDGSKLFIDDSLIVNNDGLHSVSSSAGEMNLNDSYHNITLQYFQGPRYYVALQLFAHLDKEEEQIFPGNYFSLSTPGRSSTMIWIITAALVLIMLLLIVFLRFRKAKKEEAKL